MIASSRPGTQPSNLQGIWNEELRRAVELELYDQHQHGDELLARRAVRALPECHEPLFDFIEGLAQNGEKTASRLYHCRGWCSHHNSDLWRLSEPVGRPEPLAGIRGLGLLEFERRVARPRPVAALRIHRRSRISAGTLGKRCAARGCSCSTGCRTLTAG